MKARELMTENPECVTPEERIERAAQLMRERDVGIIPVVEDRDSMRLAGVLTDRDIAVRHVADGHGDGCSVRDHMSRENLSTAGPDDDTREVLRTMQRSQVRRVPIVDNQRLVGIIAQADIAVDERVSDRESEETVEKISEPARPQR